MARQVYKLWILSILCCSPALHANPECPPQPGQVSVDITKTLEEIFQLEVDPETGCSLYYCPIDNKLSLQVGEQKLEKALPEIENQDLLQSLFENLEIKKEEAFALKRENENSIELTKINIDTKELIQKNLSEGLPENIRTASFKNLGTYSGFNSDGTGLILQSFGSKQEFKFEDFFLDEKEFEVDWTSAAEPFDSDLGLIPEAPNVEENTEIEDLLQKFVEDFNSKKNAKKTPKPKNPVSQTSFQIRDPRNQRTYRAGRRILSQAVGLNASERSQTPRSYEFYVLKNFAVLGVQTPNQVDVYELHQNDSALGMSEDASEQRFLSNQEDPAYKISASNQQLRAMADHLVQHLTNRNLEKNNEIQDAEENRNSPIVSDLLVSSSPTFESQALKTAANTRISTAAAAQKNLVFNFEAEFESKTLKENNSAETSDQTSTPSSESKSIELSGTYLVPNRKLLIQKS